MKKTATIFVCLIVFVVNAFGQTEKNESKDKPELRAILDTFMNCVKKRDVDKFYSLFHSDPVVWIGVYKEKSQQKRIQKNAALKNKNFDSDDYKTFYQNISDENVEEKFYNIVTVEDGSIASITFDYSFWAEGKRTNWGKESWGLIKTNGQWKITSVIYSVEFESVEKEPQR